MSRLTASLAAFVDALPVAWFNALTPSRVHSRCHVCVGVGAYILRTCTYIHIHICAYIYVNTYIYILYTHTHTHIHIHTYIHTHVYMYIHTHARSQRVRLRIKQARPRRALPEARQRLPVPPHFLPSILV
jgi:hypothetical protein